MPKTVIEKSKRKRGKPTLKTHIYKVLKRLHPEVGISKKGMEVMRDILTNVTDTLIHNVNQLMMHDDRETVTQEDIKTAVKLVFVDKLVKHAYEDGDKAIREFDTWKEKKSKDKKSLQSECGLVFPVSFHRNVLKRDARASRISPYAAIYLTAVMEFLADDILEPSGYAAKKSKRKRIFPRDILLAIRSDEELDKLISSHIVEGGVKPHIHKTLLPK